MDASMLRHLLQNIAIQVPSEVEAQHVASRWLPREIVGAIKILVNRFQDFDTICNVNKMLNSSMKEQLLDVELAKC